jgi:hypothetical protein
MRKLLLTAIALALAAPALAAQQDIAQISAVTASREALRTAVNTQLSAVQSNFDEVYAVIDAGPVYVNASAPADQKVVWIDTDQSNAIKVYVGGAWTVVGSGGEGSYTLPTAAADTLGGVKVGARLTITDGVLSADVQTGGGDDLGSAAYSDVVALWTTCTGYLKSDGTCDTGDGTGIAHATSDGSYYASKDGEWVSLTGLYQAADSDLASAATASTAGNLKYWGTNGTGVVGFYDVPTSGGDYPEGYMEIDGGDSTSITFAGVIDGGSSI